MARVINYSGLRICRFESGEKLFSRINHVSTWFFLLIKYNNFLVIFMLIKEGKLYFIKNEFFDYIDDKHLMKNHGSKSNRPLYLVIKRNNLIWLIPLSSKIEKYKRILIEKTIKYGRCDSILISKVSGKESVFLIQNAFPCVEKYIDHCFISNIEEFISKETKIQVYKRLLILFKLKDRGINLFKSDIDFIRQKLEKDKTLQYV